MLKKAFSNEIYIEKQSHEIKERIKRFDGKLYLEFGGKLFDDFHASRVLPGFKPDTKIRLLQSLADQAEIIFCISADDIEKTKVRADLGISYDMDVLRLIDEFKAMGIAVNSIVINKYNHQPAADNFMRKLENLGIKSYRHYVIPNYPGDVNSIVSDEGYGKNEFVETTKPLVVVTAPGPGSGKLAVCLSQVYHEHKRGVMAGYAKFETFPIWNLPLKHPVNLAYEAATADLLDVNMIDPFHMEAYNEIAVNYNRDVEAFPIVKTILTKITGDENFYRSPTDMGVNMAGNCICDDEVCREASNQEIIRRYYSALKGLAQGTSEEDEVYKIKLLMNQAHITIAKRKVVDAALKRAKETGAPATALELEDGTIITGKTTPLLGASAAMLLNALKTLAGLDDSLHLISPTVIEPIQKLKIECLGSKNPRLHTDEILIALSICAATDKNAQLALEQIPNLRGCQAHSSVMLSSVDIKQFKKLNIQLTSEANFDKKKYFG